MPTKSAMPKTSLKDQRFSLAELSAALQTDPRSLKKALDRAEEPGPRYSIHAAHAALQGDGSLESLRSARTSLTKEQNRLVELDRREREGELVDISEFETAWADAVVRMRNGIEGLDALSEHQKRTVLWVLEHATTGASMPPPPAAAQDEPPKRGHHDWESYAEKNRGVPEGIGDYEFANGLDAPERPWFFFADTGGGLTLAQIEDARSAWLRTAAGRVYLRACEQSAVRTAQLKSTNENKTQT